MSPVYLRFILVLGGFSAMGCDSLDARTAPDNTAINQRDRTDNAGRDNAKTPLDQDENASDIQMTADIRRHILAADDLSTNADNVKVITSGGYVTLRGVVNSDAERKLVAKIATDAAGMSRVDNQLEVQPD